MNKLSKILLVYYVPFVAFLLYSILASPSRMAKLPSWLFPRALSIYFIAGLVVVPLLAGGRSSVTSIKDEILSDRGRRGMKRKFQLIIATLILGGVAVFAMRLVPPRDAMSAAFNIALVLVILGILMWMRFRRKAD